MILQKLPTAGATTSKITETVPRNGTTFNTAIGGMLNNASVTVSIDAGTAQDINGQDNLASASTDNTVIYETTGPTVITLDLNNNYAGAGAGPNHFKIAFNEGLYDPAGNDEPDDVTNPANYVLVKEG